MFRQCTLTKTLPWMLLIGGIIPDVDIPRLDEIGIKGIFLPGTPMQEIVDFISRNTRSRVGL